MRDLSSTAGLFLPGRLAAEGEALTGVLLSRAPERRASDQALGPAQLRAALAVLVGRILEQDDAPLSLLAHATVDLWTELERRSSPAADELAFFPGMRRCSREKLDQLALHLEALKRSYRPVSMREHVEAIEKRGNLPGRKLMAHTAADNATTNEDTGNVSA